MPPPVLLSHLGLLTGEFPEAPPSYVVPYVWSDQYNVKIQVLGTAATGRRRRRGRR